MVRATSSTIFLSTSRHSYAEYRNKNTIKLKETHSILDHAYRVLRHQRLPDQAHCPMKAHPLEWSQTERQRPHSLNLPAQLLSLSLLLTKINKFQRSEKKTYKIAVIAILTGIQSFFFRHNLFQFY